MQIYPKQGFLGAFPICISLRPMGEAAVLASHREIQALSSMRLGWGRAPQALQCFQASKFPRDVCVTFHILARITKVTHFAKES